MESIMNYINESLTNDAKELFIKVISEEWDENANMQFEIEWNEYCKTNKIVSQFFRFPDFPLETNYDLWYHKLITYYLNYAELLNHEEFKYTYCRYTPPLL